METLLDRPAGPEPVQGDISNRISNRLTAIGQKVTMIVQEGRNSLQRIHARVSLIQLCVSDEEVMQDLKAIESACRELSRMFDEIREFAAEPPLHFSQHSICDSLERSWQHVADSRDDFVAQLNLHCNVEVDLCSFDAEKIEQVFRNVVENAIDACDGPLVMNVNVSRELDGGCCFFVVSFRDNGNGFSDNARQSALTPFFTTKKHGCGLGLCICQKILAAHNDWLKILHSPVGALISVAIPA